MRLSSSSYKCVIAAILIFVSLIPATLKAQLGSWTWMGGDSACKSPVPTEPRCSYAIPFWTDTSGQFWIQVDGGMWRYDLSAYKWSLIFPADTIKIQAAKGTYSPGNSPGIHVNGAFTWTTADDELWLYGGISQIDGCGMLWKYKVSLNQWAWMGTFVTLHHGTKGVANSANSPGCRMESNATWVDNSGNLWFWGGGDWGLNDMWKYDIQTGLWTWMSGADTIDGGKYGTIGIPSTKHYPGEGWTNFYWKDEDGFFWVGLGHNYSATDVWKFNPVTLEWTWMSGSPNAANCGPVGVLCDTSSTNQIGGRFENRSTWKISDELIITHSGAACNMQVYNDLWAYLPKQNKWVKIGDYSLGGYYGSVGVPNINNSPPGRMGAAAFTDKYKNCWLFGGTAQVGYHSLNDMWKYEIEWECLPLINTKVDNIEAEFRIDIFPNPANTTLNVSCPTNPHTTSLTIYNGFGEIVQQVNSSCMEINIAGLNAGVYIVEIDVKSHKVKKRLIKM